MRNLNLIRKIISAVLTLTLVLGCVTTVKVSAAKTSLNKTELSLTEGQSYKLKLSNAKGTVTWKSSKSYIAYVTSSGVVTGLTKGSCTITATNGSTKYECKVKVKENDVSEYMDLEWEAKDNKKTANIINQNPSHIFGYTIKKVPSWHKKQNVVVKKDKNEGYESLKAGLYPGDTVTYEDYTYDGMAIKFDVVAMQIEFKMQEESFELLTWDYFKKTYVDKRYVPPYALLAVTYHLVSHEVLDYTKANLMEIKPLEFNGEKTHPNAFDGYTDNLKNTHKRNDAESSAHFYTGSALSRNEMGILDRSELKATKTFKPNLIKPTRIDEYDLKKKPSEKAKKAGIPTDSNGYATGIEVYNSIACVEYNPLEKTIKEIDFSAKTGFVMSVDISAYVNITDNFKCDKSIYFGDLPSINNTYLNKKKVNSDKDLWARLYMNDQVPYWKHYAAFVTWDKFINPY